MMIYLIISNSGIVVAAFRIKEMAITYMTKYNFKEMKSIELR